MQEEYGRLFTFGTSSQINQDWQFTVYRFVSKNLLEILKNLFFFSFF
jgi:hypothetical protein